MILAETGVSVFSSLFSNFWVVLLLKTIAVMGFFLVVPLGVGYVEHKGLAHMQARLGPMEAGRFHGWAQLVADGVKFIQKEDVIPAAADRNVFSLAPAVAMIPYIAILVVLPISDSWFAENLACDLSLRWAQSPLVGGEPGVASRLLRSRDPQPPEFPARAGPAQAGREGVGGASTERTWRRLLGTSWRPAPAGNRHRTVFAENDFRPDRPDPLAVSSDRPTQPNRA